MINTNSCSDSIGTRAKRGVQLKPDRVDFEAKWRNSMLSMLSEHVEAAHVPTVQQPTVFSFLQATKTPIKDDTLFFSSSVANVALWLGPYMSISSKSIICTRTQKVRKCRQITTNQKPHKPARRPANPPARFAFRQEKQQTRQTKGARAQTKTPTKKDLPRDTAV